MAASGHGAEPQYGRLTAVDRSPMQEEEDPHRRELPARGPIPPNHCGLEVEVKGPWGS